MVLRIILLIILLPFFNPAILLAGDKIKIDIREYGAKGDGVTINTSSINQAIEECSHAGGGCVIIPEGVYLSGTVRLKSHVSIYLEKGAILKGVPDLEAYESYYPVKDMTRYASAYRPHWNKGLLLGVGIENVTISGEGRLDGDHLLDPEGEEKMRGPHILLLAESKNITIAGIHFDKAANYAFMGYELENLIFQNLLFSEGWDGIHIRGGKRVVIRNCDFYTGDDGIAGGYWEDMTITDCHINSSCNGIRVIMPVCRMEIAHCSFEGPGKYPHRTSGEQRRNNMLAGIIIQPGGWGKAPGEIEDILIHHLRMKDMDAPLTFVLNEENHAGKITIQNVHATGIKKAAFSVESWKGGSYEQVSLRDISVEYKGYDDSELKEIPLEQPQTDARPLPCWGLFARNVKHLSLENLRFTYQDIEVRPAFIFDNVGTVYTKQVSYKSSLNKDGIRFINSGEIKGEFIIER